MTGAAADSRRLGIGFVGSGFIARFHIRSMVGVRDADVRGCWSPSREHAEEAAALARELEVGDARAFPSIDAMVADPAVDAVWICGPNLPFRPDGARGVRAGRGSGAPGKGTPPARVHDKKVGDFPLGVLSAH